MAESNNNSGVIAILLVIVMLLIGGFLYYQMRGNDAPDEIRIEVPEEIGRDNR